jgi:hypothetical protein
MRLIPGVLTVAVACGTLACASSPTEPTPDDGLGPQTRQLVEALRSQGATVEVVEVFPESQNPEFKTESVRLRLDGADVWVYEYPTVAEADEVARRVPYIITVTLYISAPHFFRGSRLIVLYVGLDTALLSRLERLLGPPFVG